MFGMVGMIIGLVILAGCIGLSIFGIRNVIRDKQVPLPLIGKIRLLK